MITPKQYSEIFDELLEEVGEEKENEAIGSFVGLLKKNSDLRLADKIIEEYQRMGAKRVRVTSARALPEMLKKELKRFGEVEEKIDPSLIGGAKVRVEDTLIDGSVKNILARLKSKFV